MCGVFYSSILFYSILFYSILFYSILFYCVLFHYLILFYCVVFCSVLLWEIEEERGVGGGGHPQSPHKTLPEGEFLLKPTAAAPGVPSGVSPESLGFLAAETMPYSPGTPSPSSRKNPEF